MEGHRDRNLLFYAPAPISRTQDERGRIDFLSDGTARIIFTEKADASTAIHEFEHFFVNEALAIVNDKTIPDNAAKQQLRKDMSILAKKAGVKLKTLDDAVNPANWITDIHENVSKLFEAYMRTGKAPIRELDGVFSLMKDLLTEIYKYAKDIIGIKVTKDVREVV